VPGVDHSGQFAELPVALDGGWRRQLSSTGRAQVGQDRRDPAMGVRLLVVAELGEDGADVLLNDRFRPVRGLGNSGIGQAAGHSRRTSR
jgi:hypothetical protein